jgi:hypothetical protein
VAWEAKGEGAHTDAPTPHRAVVIQERVDVRCERGRVLEEDDREGPGVAAVEPAARVGDSARRLTVGLGAVSWDSVAITQRRTGPARGRVG